MQLVMYEYLEINLIGVVLLLTLLLFTRKNRDSALRNFDRMLLLNALILFADSAIYLLRYRASPWLIALTHGLCLAYFIPQLWFCYDWLRYVDQRFHPGREPSRKQKLCWSLPALANTVLVASSPFNGWIYSLSAQNVYHRGPYLWVPFLIALFYWVESSGLVLLDLRHPARKLEPGEYWRMLIFPIPILIGNLLQLRFYGMSIVWVLSVISMLVMFLDIQYEQLSRDTLTGLYNRRQADSQLGWELARQRDAGDLLFVALFDVDHFKQINDRYGHLAGDQALILVARTLRGACRRDDFASRFGGDEFLLVGHVREETDAAALMRRIEAEIAAARGQFPCAITLSAGYTLLSAQETCSLDAALSAADRRMYEAKHRKAAAPGSEG